MILTVTLDPREADPLQPNSTVLRYPTRAYQSDRASPRHAGQHTPRAEHEAPTRTHPVGASPCPLDRKSLHISCEPGMLWTRAACAAGPAFWKASRSAAVPG